MAIKYLFIDRDGTIIAEPEDEQVDRLDKLVFEPEVIPVLRRFLAAGYRLVMITNQDGLGTDSFPQADFEAPHQLMLDVLTSQGVVFEAVRICPHFDADGCACRKPRVGMVQDFLAAGQIDRARSFVIGDRESDLALAENMGLTGLRYDRDTLGWPAIAAAVLEAERTATVVRRTNETAITCTVNLDRAGEITIETGLAFFDHMLEQIARHGGFSLQLHCAGDLAVDEHHTIEDTALALGQALREALGDKRGIGRYGFLMPMDEALAHAALDLGGRPWLVFEATFARERVGVLPTEMVSHFFKSLTDTLGATLHLKAHGDNTHHVVESLFKALGRTLRQALRREGQEIPSTKGVI